MGLGDAEKGRAVGEGAVVKWVWGGGSEVRSAGIKAQGGAGCRALHWVLGRVGTGDAGLAALRLCGFGKRLLLAQAGCCMADVSCNKISSPALLCGDGFLCYLEGCTLGLCYMEGEPEPPPAGYGAGSCWFLKGGRGQSEIRACPLHRCLLRCSRAAAARRGSQRSPT